MRIRKSIVLLLVITVLCSLCLCGCGEEKGEVDCTFTLPPQKYLNASDSTSLLHVDELKYYGVYYFLITRREPENGLDFKSQKIIVFEGTVTEDFYGNLCSGDKIHIAFPLEYVWGNSPNIIEASAFIKTISDCQSLVFYTDSINRDFYGIYEDQACEGERIQLEPGTDNLCLCWFYSDGVIPLRDGVVDFSPFHALDAEIGFEIEHSYKNINLSGYSISQGDSAETMRKTILKLIETKVYGGE